MTKRKRRDRDSIRLVFILEVKLEVELPRAATLSKNTMVIGEGKTKLNDLKQVNIATQGLIVIVSSGSERPNRASNNAWKLCILFMLYKCGVVILLFFSFISCCCYVINLVFNIYSFHCIVYSIIYNYYCYY